MENGENRRLSRRVCIELPVAAKPVGWISKKKVLAGRTVDLALSGLQLRLDNSGSIRQGDPVEIRIQDPDTKAFVHLEGKIKWVASHPERKDTVRVGVVLTELDLEDYNNWVEFLYCYIED